MSNQNTGPGFSNIQGVPTVAQPAQPAVPQRVGFNRNYLLSVTGILRLVLIVNIDHVYSYLRLQFKFKFL